MPDDVVSYMIAQERQREIDQELVYSRLLVKEAQAAHRARAEKVRQRRQCLTRSVLFEFLPASVARLVAPPCTPACCAPTVAA